MNKKILEHFKKNDPVLYSIASKTRLEKYIKKEKTENYFLKLCREIIGQQLSGRVAEVIFGRFRKLYKNKVTPRSVLKTEHEKLRSIGMSNAKAKYVKNLAAAVVERKLQIDALDKLPDDEVKKQLVQVKGIGPWTAEMFLMFTLGRPDVFSHGDLGLKKALKKLYGFKKDPDIKTVEKVIKKWSPYKTYASLILWTSLETLSNN